MGSDGAEDLRRHRKMDARKYERNHTGLAGSRYMENIDPRCCTGG